MSQAGTVYVIERRPKGSASQWEFSVPLKAYVLAEDAQSAAWYMANRYAEYRVTTYQRSDEAPAVRA